VDVQLTEPTAIAPFDYKWPGGEIERFDRAWDVVGTSNGRTFKVRHALREREVFGRKRFYSVTLVDGYPSLLATAADDYKTSHALLSFVRLPNNKRALRQDEVPPDYAGVPIVEHADEIHGPKHHSGLAFKLREDDVASWARCAIVRAELRARWLKGAGLPAQGDWDDFVKWAARFYRQPTFPADERDYKVTIADHLRNAKKAVDEGAPGWIESLQRAFGPPNNLTAWQMRDNFLRWVRSNSSLARDALVSMWSDKRESGIASFLQRLPNDQLAGKGTRLSLASFLRMALDEHQFPFYKPTPVSLAYKLAGYASPDATADETATYVHFLGFLDTFIAEADERGLVINDRLDAQGLVWCISSTPPTASWPAEEREALLQFRSRVGGTPIGGGSGTGPLERLRELLELVGADPGHLWMVAQGASYRTERQASILRAPQLAGDGRPRPYWTALTELEVGDTIIHYANSAFRAVGTVKEPAQQSQLAGTTGTPAPGWSARVEYHEVDPPVQIGAIPAEWRQGEPGFTADGTVRQGYLFHLSPALAERLLGIAPAVGVSGVVNSEGVPVSFDDLMAKTLWTRAALEEVIEALRGDSYQVVLAGPPGTGKTWVARWLVRYLTQGRSDLVKIVQFHPSYSYEQFVEGLRPVVNEAKAISFEPTDGIVLKVARQIQHGGPDHFLIIDEMNRANLPRVLGELMYLFEYRDEAIDLPYTTDFKLPKELRFIGTMNTADRSIRSIDIALRRRFDVFDCLSDPSILTRFYETRVNQVSDLIVGFEKLNMQLTDALDQYHTIGQTFFMADEMTASKLRQVWRRKLLPLIQEYFFDQPDRVEEYQLRLLWPSVG
jgi:hypothetical protein